MRGGKYEEVGVTKDNKIAYRNNGSYYVVGEGDDGFKNIPATDITTNYFIRLINRIILRVIISLRI